MGVPCITSDGSSLDVDYPLSSICIDPRSVAAATSGGGEDSAKRYSYWIGDNSAVYHIDGSAGGLSTLVAGSAGPHAAVGWTGDGVGSDVWFHLVIALICSGDAKWLYLIDHHNSCLRSIEVATQRVRTLYSMADSSGGPDRAKLCFDRSPHVKPESAVFLTGVNGILRFDFASSAAQSVSLGQYQSILKPHGIASTETGILIFTCWKTDSVWALEIGRSRHKTARQTNSIGWLSARCTL